jgi:hypothetical protein
MERVARRFLLHNSREKEEVKESDFDELKQDLQMVRFELTNDINKFRENLTQCTAMIHKGLSLLGEFFLQNDLCSEISQRFKSFRAQDSILLNDATFDSISAFAKDINDKELKSMDDATKSVSNKIDE